MFISLIYCLDKMQRFRVSFLIPCFVANLQHIITLCGKLGIETILMYLIFKQVLEC